MKFSAGRGIIFLLAGFLCLSCSTIFEDQSECPRGIRLDFVYELNMEHSNSFPHYAHCLDVFLFDAEDRLVDVWEEDLSSSEQCSITKPLAPGEYSVIVWAGAGCGDASFRLEGLPLRSGDAGKLKAELLTEGGLCSESLHPLFHGQCSFSIGVDDYVRKTVYLTKDTNNFKIILQQSSSSDIKASDFEVSITDSNNAVLGWDNSILGGDVTYLPWTSGEQSLGDSLGAAWFEFSTSRLQSGSRSRLVIKRRADGGTVLDIPLCSYLLLLKSELYSQMGADEYLDRESDWSLVFFLDGGLNWIDAYIIVNDWRIVLNDVGF